jgi:hypothetical protein
MTRRGAVLQNGADGRLAELEAEARFASDRHRLYRARVVGSSPTSPGRLRELERASRRAEARLRRAKSGETRLLTALKPTPSSPETPAGMTLQRNKEKR